MVSRKAMGIIASVSAALALPATALAFRLRAASQDRPVKSTSMPTARTSGGVSEIGALYASARATQHGCTASVIESPHGNTLITAAHCVSGTGAGMMFDPAQHGAQQPYGRWTVTATHVEPEWIAHQDPDADVAFLTVAPRTINGVRTDIEQVTGAYKLGSTAIGGQRVTVTGYPAGSTNDPVTCTADVYLTRAYPTFSCLGYVSGTSGAPWLLITPRGTEVVGVIGGLNQGGCHDYTSYTSPLARKADLAYLHAAEDVTVDVAPQPSGDGC